MSVGGGVVDYYIQDKMVKLFVVAKNSRDDQSCLVPTDVAGADCVPCRVAATGLVS